MSRPLRGLSLAAAALAFAGGAALAQQDPPPPPQSVWELHANGMPQWLELWNGDRYQFSYDALERLRRVAGSDQVWELDAAGRYQRARSRLGTVSFDYDPLDRLQEIRFEPTGTPAVASIHYAYDATSRIRHVTVVDGSRGSRYSIDVGRDLLGRIERMSLGGRDVTFEYRDHQVVRRNPDGIRTTFTYDARGLLSRIRHDDMTRQQTLLSQITYDLDPGCRKITVGLDVPGRAIEFNTFDAAARHQRQGATADGRENQGRDHPVHQAFGHGFHRRPNHPLPRQ